MSEFAPARIRGRVIVWLEAFWALGWILAAVIGTFVAASGPTGWRWALAVGLVPAAYSLVIRLGMPESVRFLERKGRNEEAERVVRSFEEAAGIDAPGPASAAAEAGQVGAGGAAAEGPVAAAGRVAADEVGTIPAADQVETSGGIWSAPLRARTAGLWAVWFCINLSYYGAFI